MNLLDMMKQFDVDEMADFLTHNFHCRIRCPLHRKCHEQCNKTCKEMYIEWLASEEGAQKWDSWRNIDNNFTKVETGKQVKKIAGQDIEPEKFVNDETTDFIVKNNLNLEKAKIDDIGEYLRKKYVLGENSSIWGDSGEKKGTLDVSGSDEDDESIEDLKKFQKLTIDDIVEIKLMSADEAERIPVNVRRIDKDYWLQDQGCYSTYAALVDRQGKISGYGYRVDADLAIRPALYVPDLEKYEIGNYREISWFGCTWIVLGHLDLLLAKDSIGQQAFNNIYAGCDYQDSNIQKWLHKWLEDSIEREKYKMNLNLGWSDIIT